MEGCLLEINVHLTTQLLAQDIYIAFIPVPVFAQFYFTNKTCGEANAVHVNQKDFWESQL